MSDRQSPLTRARPRAEAQAMPAGTTLLAIGALACLAPPASAGDFLSGATLDGILRAYDYHRMYDDPNMSDASAFSSALLLNARSGEFGGGFAIGASLVTANALGTLPSPTRRIDVTLMGGENSLTALSQAYVQFGNDTWTLRAGDQYLDTPWMGMSDSRVLPVSYRAVNIKAMPTPGWMLELVRSYDWKSRTSDRFFADNLYYPTNFDGDPVYGGNGSLPANARSYSGTWALGSTYVNGSFHGEAWFYDFLHFGRMAYLDGTWTMQPIGRWTPFASAQLVEEWSGGDNTLADTGTKIVGMAGSRVRSEIPGLDLGVRIAGTKFDLSWNRVARQDARTIGGGALISPFTATYATDPLYTTSMLRGLVEQGPGRARKARLTQDFFGERLQVVAAYTQYRTEYRGDSKDVYLDVIYRPTGPLNGLELRNRWERSSGGANNLNPGDRPFSYDRVMISYAF